MLLQSSDGVQYMVSTEPERYLNKVHIKKVISHPFLILVVGAIISGLLVPYFTHQWQDNQKQLELKTALADDINKAVSDSIVSGRLYPTGHANPSDFDNSLKNWEISKEIISSKIQAYFSDNATTHRRDDLSSAVKELSYYILPAFFPEAGDPNYNYDVCNRLGHVLKLYNTYYKDKAL